MKSTSSSSSLGAAGSCLVTVGAFLLVVSTAHGMYDPKHGRWLQRDPLGVRADPPRATLTPSRQYTDGMCPYAYAYGRPTVSRDATGESPTCDDVPIYLPPDQRPGMSRIEPDPSLGSPMRKKCRDAVASPPSNLPKRARCLWNAMTKRGCPTPTLQCACCGSSLRGCYSPKTNAVAICFNHLGSSQMVEEAIEHEVSHAWEKCKRDTEDHERNGCYKSACEEVKAAWCSGTCDPGGSSWKVGDTKSACVRREARGGVAQGCFWSADVDPALNEALSKPMCQDCEGCPSEDPLPNGCWIDTVTGQVHCLR
jgi:hypothetical protein